MTQFVYFTLTGADANKFLQGQLTCDVTKLNAEYTPAAICNLKGRVHFGLWLKKAGESFELVLSADLAEDFSKHIKKYGAFSKIQLTDAKPIYPSITNGAPSFNINNVSQGDEWQKLSIAQGNYWLTKATSELFQPQELRLHQRGGVAYDKGCYLGQEIVARLYFKASPKAYLHRITFDDSSNLTDKIQIVNQITREQGLEALVIARPDDLQDIQILPLPAALQAAIGRE